MNIRPIQPEDIETVKAFTVRAFVPVFKSFEDILGKDVYPYLHPKGVESQRDVVQMLLDKEDSNNWVADIDGVPVGYIVYGLNHETEVGEIEFLAVDPTHHGKGIATALNKFALTQLKDGGMKVATVSTGGDPAHLPARNAYEKVGFKSFPGTWYSMSLD